MTKEKDPLQFWKEVAITLGFMALLIALPFLFYSPELSDAFGYGIVKIAFFIILPASLVAAFMVVKYRDDAGYDWTRYAGLFLALVFSIAVMATASNYRQDKKAKIEYNKK